MNPLIHAINIGTLATWLSVSGFGVVAGFIPVWHPAPPKPKLLEALPVSEDFTLGDDQPINDSPPDAPAESNVPETLDLPAPPELPDIAEFEPLPEIPDLPAPKPAESPTPLATKPAPRPSNSSKPLTSAKPKTQATRPGSASGSIKTTGGGSGMSESARLAAGRMPPPPYPPFARRNGQTGTVLVEFTVDASGRVISAYVKSSSNWPLLDIEAVRTVRSWTFPPGGVMKRLKPIRFTLN